MSTPPPSYGGPGPPEPVSQPLAGRYRRLILALRVGVVAAGLLAAVGVLAPDPVGTAASRGFLGVVISVPLLRVTWLSVRWVNRRDLRFAALGATLLAVVGCAALTAF